MVLQRASWLTMASSLFALFIFTPFQQRELPFHPQIKILNNIRGPERERYISGYGLGQPAGLHTRLCFIAVDGCLLFFTFFSDFSRMTKINSR